MTTLYLDIETLPAAWTSEQIDGHAARSVPANYSKPETISKWISENRDEAHARTALDWRYCRILAIGYALDDEPAECLYSEHGDDEGLHAMFDALAERVHAKLRHDAGLVVVGHNAVGFDIPILTRHAWRLVDPIARMFRLASVHDTGEIWKAGDRRANMAKLSDIAEFLGLGGKGEGLSGSEIYPAWLAGDHERIRRYCAQDVELARAIYRRCRVLA